MAMASHLALLGVFTYHGNIRVPAQAAMLVTTSGMVSARAVKDYSGPMLALTY
jgi:hypothetical protein